MAHNDARDGKDQAHVRKLLEERWRKILEEAAESPLTQTEYCRRNSLNPGLYFWWKGEIRRRDGGKRRPRRSAPVEPPAFLPVRIRPAAQERLPEAYCSPLEVVLKTGRLIRVRPSFDRNTLLDLVNVLEASTC